MTYDTVNYADVEPVGEGMHFLRDPLDCEHLGVTVLECDPGWSGKPHDHADQDHEEVYLLVEGEATVTVEGDDVDMAPGDAIRIDPDAYREIQAGDAECRFVLVGAP